MRIDLSILMAEYCDGDESAFRRLYACTAPSLLRYLQRLMRDRALAEEVMQQTFVKVYMARHVYRRGSDPLPWLYAIGRRTALDELRRAKRMNQLFPNERDSNTRFRCGLHTGECESWRGPAAAGSAATSGPVDFGSNPEAGHDSAEVLSIALETLPENQRAAIVTTKIQGNSTVEAAAILGTTPGAIRVRSHRGFVALRRLLFGVRYLAGAVFISSGATVVKGVDQLALRATVSSGGFPVFGEASTPAKSASPLGR